MLLNPLSLNPKTETVFGQLCAHLFGCLFGWRWTRGGVGVITVSISSKPSARNTRHVFPILCDLDQKQKSLIFSLRIQTGLMAVFREKKLEFELLPVEIAHAPSAILEENS